MIHLSTKLLWMVIPNFMSESKVQFIRNVQIQDHHVKLSIMGPMAMTKSLEFYIHNKLNYKLWFLIGRRHHLNQDNLINFLKKKDRLQDKNLIWDIKHDLIYQLQMVIGIVNSFKIMGTISNNRSDKDFHKTKLVCNIKYHLLA